MVRLFSLHSASTKLAEGKRSILFRIPFFSVFILYCFLILVRAPQILLKQRVWAEEAWYLQAAFSHPLGEMLTYVKGGMGYRNLYLNAAAYLAANAFPLDYAPLAFISFGLASQLAPLALLWLARVELKLTVTCFTLMALCLLLAVPNYDLWLTTFGSGYVLSASTAIILISPVFKGLRKWLNRAVLLVAGSTGMPSLFLIPLFLHRAVRERQRERIVQTVLLLCGGLLQAWALTGGTTRAYLFSTDAILGAVLANQVLLPLFGYDLVLRTSGFIETLRIQLAANQLSARNYAELVLCIALFGSVLWLVGRGSRRIETAYLFCAAMLMSLLSIAGSLGGVQTINQGGDGRYFYVPNVLVLFGIVLALTTGALTKWVRRLATIALIYVLAVGAVEYFRYPSYYTSGPAWKEEVAAWRREPWRPIHTSPASAPWSVQPTPNVGNYSESMLPSQQGRIFQMPVSLSAGANIAQRFLANADGLDEIRVQLVTWARPAQAHDYAIEWQLEEISQFGKRVRAQGNLAAITAEDWAFVRLSLPRLSDSDGKWFELTFKAPGDRAESQAIGVPVYSLTPSNIRLQPAVLNGVAMADSVVNLSIGYAAIRN